MIFAAMDWLGLQTADWAVLALYFVVILAIGLWSITKVKDMSDFFMGGRRFGKIFMMFFAFGAGTSSEQAISVVAGSWRVGLAGIWWQFLWLWATPFYWIVAPILRRTRALTTADFFEARYNAPTATLYSIYGIIMSIVFIAGGLYGSGKMVTALTGGELDRMARERDVQVPELSLSLDSDEFGRTKVFEMPVETAGEITGDQLPESLRVELEKRKRVSDELTVRETTPGKRWEIVDSARGVSYPVWHRTFKVMQPVEAEEEEPAADADENAAPPAAAPKMVEVEVERYIVYGSGWRLLEGYEYAILAMTLLFVLYGMAGGLGAAIITDFIQGILTITFSFLLLPFVFAKIGGFGALHEQAAGTKPGMLDLIASADVAKSMNAEPITAFYVCMLSVTALAGIVVQPHIMGVCGAGKTEMEGRFGFTVGNFLKRFCTIAWTFTGLACIIWYLSDTSPLLHTDKPLTPAAGAAFDELTEEEQAQQQAAFAALSTADQKTIVDDRATYASIKLRNDTAAFEALEQTRKGVIAAEDKGFADKLFGRAAFDILPTIAPGLVGLLLASLLAAVMSTSDAQMIISSGLFTENIYRRFLVRDKSQRHYLWAGRIAGLVIVGLALILQATFTDVIDALRVILKTPAFIGISLWFGITWRKWNSWAVWVSTVAGAVTWLMVANFHKVVYDWNVLPIEMFSLDSTGVPTKMTDAWQMFSFMTVGIVTGIIVSFITPRQPEEKLDHFFRLMRTPVTPGEEIERPCTLPENPAEPQKKMVNIAGIELPMPTFVDIGGFALAWCGVALIIWLTNYLAKVL